MRKMRPTLFSTSYELTMFGFNFINRELKILVCPKLLGHKILIYQPNNIKKISLLVSDENWLFHSFKDGSNTYNASNYLLSKKINNRKYTIVLDTNIYDFLLKSLKKPGNPKLRCAVALLVFCQLSEIQIDPFFATQEKLKNDDIEKILDDLALFNKINNAESITLMHYALGVSDRIYPNENAVLSRDLLKQEVLSYRKSGEWKSLYLMILKIVDIKFDESIPDSKKLSTYLNWLVDEFRMGVPGIIYALVFFGGKPVRNMMKYKPSDAASDKSKSINNMTWDLFIIRNFFKKWENKREDEEFIFASDDKAFGKILLLSIRVYKERSFESCRGLGHINSHNLTRLNNLFNQAVISENRAYRNPNLNCEDRASYRDNLILEHERRLGMN